MRSGETPAGARAAGPQGSALVPTSSAANAGIVERRAHVVVSENRAITFGFLLGYLSLALHATLEYTRFAGYYVGPWEEEPRVLEIEGARAWTRVVARRGTYSAETVVGTVTVVISDEPDEPRASFARLGVPDPDPEPTRRLAVRPRLPRVDLVVEPNEGFAFDLHGFAHEVGERFRRNLD